MSARHQAATDRALPFVHPDDMPDRYAINGVGTCMFPVIADGASVAFDKRQPCAPGDIVGIILGRAAAARYGSPGMIKRLVASDFFGSVIVEQENPPRRLAIPTDDVLAIHKMIGIAERRANGFAVVRLPKQGAGQ